MLELFICSPFLLQQLSIACCCCCCMCIFNCNHNRCFSKIFASVGTHASNKMLGGKHFSCCCCNMRIEIKSESEIHGKMHQFATWKWCFISLLLLFLLLLLVVATDCCTQFLFTFYCCFCIFICVTATWVSPLICIYVDLQPSQQTYMPHRSFSCPHAQKVVVPCVVVRNCCLVFSYNCLLPPTLCGSSRWNLSLPNIFFAVFSAQLWFAIVIHKFTIATILKNVATHCSNICACVMHILDVLLLF